MESPDLVYSYTRREAIEDGVLVDLTAGDLALLVREAGFRCPVAMTATSFRRYVALTPAAERAGNDIRGRLWDVLIMLRHGIRRELSRGTDTDRVLFDFWCVVDRITPSRCRLKAVLGPDDDGRPCFTLMLPEED